MLTSPVAVCRRCRVRLHVSLEASEIANCFVCNSRRDDCATMPAGDLLRAACAQSHPMREGWVAASLLESIEARLTAIESRK